MNVLKFILLTYVMFMFLALMLDALADALSEMRTKLRALDISAINNVLVILRFITSTLHELTHSLMIIITFGKLKSMQVAVGDIDQGDINGLCVSKQHNFGKVADYFVDSLIGTAPLMVSTVITLTWYFNVVVLNINEENKNFMLFILLEIMVSMALLFDTSSDVDLGLVPNRNEAYINKRARDNKEVPKGAYKFSLGVLLYQKSVLIKRLSIPAIIYSVIFALTNFLA